MYVNFTPNHSDYPLNILVYNGDADGVCNFLGDEWFVEALGLDHVTDRQEWDYKQGSNYLSTNAGYVKKFKKGSVNVDLLTIKVGKHRQDATMNIPPVHPILISYRK